MMVGKLGVLNAFSTYGYFQLMMGLSGHNPIVSGGRSVFMSSVILST